MAEDDRFNAILRLSPRYVIVRASSPDGVCFRLAGHTNELEQLGQLHSGIANCKPGIWKALAKPTPDELQKLDVCWEVCLRWVGELEPDTELDFAAGLEQWKDWDRKMQEKFGDVGGLGDNLVWKSDGAYYDDGGLCNVISSDYLTESAAKDIMKGRKMEDGGDADDENDEDEDEETEMGYYLEKITLNEDSLGDWLDNDTFALGGLNCEPKPLLVELRLSFINH